VRGGKILNLNLIESGIQNAIFKPRRHWRSRSFDEQWDRDRMTKLEENIALPLSVICTE
jgi:hypothetical protein